MYRAHLQKQLTGGSGRPAEEDDADAGNTSPNNASAPLTSDWVTPAQSKAVAAAVLAAEEAASLSVPVRIEGPQASSRPVAVLHRGAGYGVAVTSGASASTLGGGASGGGSAEGLDVSGAQTLSGGGGSAAAAASAAAAGAAAAAPRPVIISTGMPLVKSGSSSCKLGAKRLGGARLGSGGGGGGGSFDFDAKDAASDAPASPVSAKDAAAAGETGADALARTLAAMETGTLARGMGSYSSPGGGRSGSGAVPSAATGTSDFSKFKNSKAISSDMLFASGNDERSRADAAKLNAYGDARAISSDMIFGDGGGSGGGGSGSGSGGGRKGRANSGGEGLSDFMDKLASSVSEDARKIVGSLGERGAKVKEGLGLIAESLMSRR